jgi:6-pyruvoyltetrahydropterin/6-carboxytetrahydropterin synthase
MTHALRLYDGVREPMHAHTWRVTVQVSSRDLDVIGAVMDFTELKQHLDAVLAPLEGQTLNDLPLFADRNPSSEIVAAHIFEAIAPRLPRRVELEQVTILRDEAIRATFTYSAK